MDIVDGVDEVDCYGALPVNKSNAYKLSMVSMHVKLLAVNPFSFPFSKYGLFLVLDKETKSHDLLSPLFKTI